MNLEKNPLEKQFERGITAFQDFVRDQTMCSIVLILSTLLAFSIANSPLRDGYESLLKTPLGFSLGDALLTMSLKHWINDGLMALFFFLLGMEIKREVLAGEIKAVKYMTPVLAAAMGGMLVPAMIYATLNSGTEFSKGWGIPMATDTAFAIGILATLGSRIPRTAFAFLTALAIIDDLGAILVIAFFYTETINTQSLAICGSLFVLLIFCNVLGIRSVKLYAPIGIVMWAFMLSSGLHATVAGILVAATIPARPKHNPSRFVGKVRKLLHKFERMERKREANTPILGEDAQHAVAERVQDAAEKATTPLRRWEQALEYPVALFVLPVFALANAGISIPSQGFYSLMSNTLAGGIILGLVVGKGIGIPLFAWLAVRFGGGHLLPSLNWQQIIGIGLFGGIGFTMSMFISSLGFEHSPETLLVAKTGIVTASLISGVSGYIWLRFCKSET